PDAPPRPQDLPLAVAPMRDVFTGIFHVNAPTIGAEVHLPFRGTKATAMGTARPASPRSTSSPSGSRSTWTSAGGCSGAQIDTEGVNRGSWRLPGFLIREVRRGSKVLGSSASSNPRNRGNPRNPGTSHYF